MLDEYVPFKRHFILPKKKNSFVLELGYIVTLVASYFLWPFEGGFEVIGDYLLFVLWGCILLLLISIANVSNRKYLIPNLFVYPFFGLVATFKILQSVLESSVQVLVGALIGLLIVWGFTVLIYVVSKGKWIGYGNVRLSAAVGLLLGWQLGLLAVLIFALLTALIYLLIRIKNKSWSMQVGSGPIWLVVVLICFFFGEKILSFLK